MYSASFSLPLPRSIFFRRLLKVWRRKNSKWHWLKGCLGLLVSGDGRVWRLKMQKRIFRHVQVCMGSALGQRSVRERESDGVHVSREWNRMRDFMAVWEDRFGYFLGLCSAAHILKQGYLWRMLAVIYIITQVHDESVMGIVKSKGLWERSSQVGHNRVGITGSHQEKVSKMQIHFPPVITSLYLKRDQAQKNNNI